MTPQVEFCSAQSPFGPTAPRWSSPRSRLSIAMTGRGPVNGFFTNSDGGGNISHNNNTQPLCSKRGGTAPVLSRRYTATMTTCDEFRQAPTSLRRAADDGQPWDMLSDELRGAKTRHTWRGGERPDELRRLPCDLRISRGTGAQMRRESSARGGGRDQQFRPKRPPRLRGPACMSWGRAKRQIRPKKYLHICILASSWEKECARPGSVAG